MGWRIALRRRIAAAGCAAFWILSLAGVAGPGAAVAGAWPRDEGEVFLSLGGNLALFGDAVRPVHYDPTVYLEYGLTDRLTLGFDGYTADAGSVGSLFGWARMPLGPTDRNAKWAVSGALGATLLASGRYDPMLRLGLHWGRGLDDGWLAVDAQAQVGVGALSHQAKIDASWGYGLGRGWTVLMQGQVGYGLQGDLYAKLSPSLVYKVNDAISLRAGLTRALTGDRGGGLTFETWLRF